MSKQNEIVTNKLMIFFTAAVGAVIFLIILNGRSASPFIIYGFTKPAFVSLFITGALAALSAAYMIYSMVNGIDGKERTFTGHLLFAVALPVFLMNFILYYNYGKMANPAPHLIVASIVLALLGFVYYLYQRDFFILGAVSAAGCYGLYFINLFAGPAVTGILRALVIILSLAAAAYAYYKARGGKSGIIPALPSIILAALLIAACVLSLFTAAYVVPSIIAILAYTLAAGIVYTIKLI